jgi:hypothetical protein
MSFSAMHTEKELKKFNKTQWIWDLKKAERDFEVGDGN